MSSGVLSMETATARSKYLNFHRLIFTGKTLRYSVDSRSGGYRLGIIKWYGAWRQYVLFPESNTVWNKTCLQDVNAFIDGLMEARSSRQGQS